MGFDLMKKKNQNLGIKIDALGAEDLKEVNQMLKALSSDKVIGKSEAAHMRELGDQVKGIGKKVLGFLK